MHPETLKQTVSQTISLPEDTFLNIHDRAAIDIEITTHEELLQSLRQRLAALKNHRNSLSPTWRLPMEVLSDIMLVATQLAIKENNESDVYPTTLPVPLVLGQVCAAWRTLAWKLPGLWSTIPLAVAKARYDKQIELLDEWLARAGELQHLYIVLTLRHDYQELQYWRDYPPKEILTRLYKRSPQWHTFYSTLPNLCFDLLASVHERLPNLHTLILNRSGRLAYEPFFNGLGTIPGIQNGTFVAGPPIQFTLNAPAFGPVGAGVGIAGGPIPAAPPPPPHHHGQPPPLAAINLNDETTRKKNPWYMLSTAPSLRTVVLPEALNPSDITLPWTHLTHLEVRTIPIDDCLRVLQHTPHIVSFDFHGIYSGPLTFLPTPHLHLPELRKLNVFSDPANLSRFLDSLTAPNLYSVEFKSTTGTLSMITSQLTLLVQRSGCQLTKLGVCIPSIGRSEEQIVTCLMGEELCGLEEIVLESWQVDVEGLSDLFLQRMNPERRIRTVKTYSYPLQYSSSSAASSFSGSAAATAGGGGTGMNGGAPEAAIVVAPGWVDVPTDEIRDVVEQVVEVPEGEWVEPQEILLPNLVAMTYKGTLSFSPKTLKETLMARWKRKSRKSTVPRLVMPPPPLPSSSEEDGDAMIVEEDGKEIVVMQEEEWFPTAELVAFEIIAPETDLREPIDEGTNLVFRQMLREGFCLSIETKKGPLAF